MRDEITSASKAYASAGKEIVALGRVTKFMLQLDTAVEKQSTAILQIATPPKRVINFMNEEAYCMIKRQNHISYLG